MTKTTTIVEAATTTKGRSLTGDAAKLLALTDTHSFAQRQFEPGIARDFSQEQGTETMCALFGSIANVLKTGVEALDNEQ